jgi:hypothetical protein
MTSKIGFAMTSIDGRRGRPEKVEDRRLEAKLAKNPKKI